MALTKSTNRMTTGASINALDFIPSSEHAAIIAGTSTYDAKNDLQSAINQCSGGGVLYIPDGTYVVSGSLNVVSGLCIEAEKTATIKPNANSITVFDSPGSFVSSISLNRITVSGGGFSSITAFNIDNWGQECVVNECYVTTCNKGVVMTNVVGLRLDNFTARKCEYAIECGTSANAVLISGVNIDNGTFAAGSGTGIGISVSGGTQKIIGGYIQGYEDGIKLTSDANCNIEHIYFEECDDAAINLFGVTGCTVEDCYFFGFGGTTMIKGRSAEHNFLINNRMKKSTATGGLYDFDANSFNNFEQHIVPDDGSINTDIGITNGLNPLSSSSGSLKFTTTEAGDASAGTAFNAFTVTTKDYTVTRCEVFIEAIEKTAYVASAVKKFIFTLHNDGTTLTASSVTDASDYSISKSNANYTLTPSITVTTPTADSSIVKITLTSGGAIGWSTAYYRARIVAETSGTYIGVS